MGFDVVYDAAFQRSCVKLVDAESLSRSLELYWWMKPVLEFSLVRTTVVTEACETTPVIQTHLSLEKKN